MLLGDAPISGQGNVTAMPFCSLSLAALSNTEVTVPGFQRNYSKSHVPTK